MQKNKVHKVIRKKDMICFIIQTKGYDDYWYWSVNSNEWIDYWKDRNPACLVGNIMEWAADEFVNAEEFVNTGFSCSGFLSVWDAAKDCLELQF